jgi:hypothetical protein
MTDSNGAPTYELIISGQQAQRIYALHDDALEKGLGQQFVDALKVINQQLQTNPVAFGDPLYPLPALKLIVYIRAVFPIAIDYGVHQEKRLVFVRSVRLMA